MTLFVFNGTSERFVEIYTTVEAMDFNSCRHREIPLDNGICILDIHENL